MRSVLVATVLLGCLAGSSLAEVRVALSARPVNGYFVLRSFDDNTGNQASSPPTFGYLLNWVDNQMSLMEGVLSTVLGMHPMSYEEWGAPHSSDLRSAYLHQLAGMDATSSDAGIMAAYEDQYRHARHSDFPNALEELFKVMGRRGGYFGEPDGTYDPCADTVPTDNSYDEAITTGDASLITDFEADEGDDERYATEYAGLDEGSYTEQRLLEEEEAKDETALFGTLSAGSLPHQQVLYASSKHYENMPQPPVVVAQSSANGAFLLNADEAFEGYMAEQAAGRDDDAERWGVAVFIALSAACLLVWAGLVATCCSVRNAVCARRQFVMENDSLLEPLAANDYQQPEYTVNPLTAQRS